MVNPERQTIDPDDSYPADGMREAEEHALMLLALLPGAVLERTRDVIQINYQGEEGMVALVTAESLELRLPKIEWTCGAYGPAASSRLWKRILWSKIKAGDLERILHRALEARRLEFKPCKYCGERFPPDRRHGNVCHGCAEKHEGIVH